MPKRTRTAVIPPCPAGNFILYCDTSALIKLILNEKYSNKLREFVDKCDSIAVCRITWAEAKAALSNHERQEVENLSGPLGTLEKLITRYRQHTKYRDNVQQLTDAVISSVKEAHQSAHQELQDLWKGITLIDLSDNVLNKAGEFSAKFCLKGYDSVQLSAAHEFQLIEQSSVLMFACFDEQLNRAAAKLKIKTIPNFSTSLT